MIVVLIVFFSILLVSFITGIIITIYEARKAPKIINNVEESIGIEKEKIEIQNNVEVSNTEKHNMDLNNSTSVNIVVPDAPIISAEYEDMEII